MEILELLDPETLQQLSQLGAVVSIMIIILALVWLASRLVGPFATMSKMLQQGQTSLATGIEKLTSVVTENTETFRQLSGVLEASRRDTSYVIDKLNSVQTQITKAQKMVNAGVLVANRDGDILYATPLAFDILGWEAEQLPGHEHPATAPIMTVLDQQLPPELWPMNRVIETGNRIENVPLQIFNYRDKAYHWVMVSAYPCINCQATGGVEPSAWSTLVLQRIDGFHRL